jgi:integrase
MSLRQSIDAQMEPGGTSCARPDSSAGLPPTEAAAALFGSLSASILSEQTTDRLCETVVRFATYLERGVGLRLLAEVTPAHAEGFVRAPVLYASGPRPPSVATMHLRRSAARLLFRLARTKGLVSGDPTLDVCLPPRTPGALRPLTDEEVLLCRSASLRTASETRLPAAWSLAEATARTSEIPAITGADVDLGRGQAWIHGGAKTAPRWGEVSPWGAVQIERRVQILEKAGLGDVPLAYAGRGRPASRQASASGAICSVLVRAGLAREPDVKPASVAAWAGAQLLAEGRPIEEVARCLGVNSLDAAARLIGFDWRKGA